VTPSDPSADPPGPEERIVAPWQQLAQRPRADGWLPIVTRTYRMPDGSVSDWDIHEIAFTTVAVLALTRDGQVVLTEQFRPGPGAVLLDMPGGIVDDGETIEQAAARELLEETGFRAGTIEPAGSTWAFGASTWRRHVVVARDCDQVAQPTSWGGDEYCRPVVLSMDRFREVLRSGDSTDVDLGYLALDVADLL
jgi:ADP-ribose pyrophosphatase